MGPTSSKIVADYLCEFMWMQRFSEHGFFHFWDQVVTAYPV